MKRITWTILLMSTVASSGFAATGVSLVADLPALDPALGNPSSGDPPGRIGARAGDIEIPPGLWIASFLGDAPLPLLSTVFPWPRDVEKRAGLVPVATPVVARSRPQGIATSQTLEPVAGLEAEHTAPGLRGASSRETPWDDWEDRGTTWHGWDYRDLTDR